MTPTWSLTQTRVAGLNRSARPAAPAGAACFLALLIASGSCGAGTDGPAHGALPADTLFLDPAVTIGLEEGDPDYLFGKITSVATDDAGRIYVGDAVGATVRVFDADGSFIRQLAREGPGPGEISGRPAHMTFDDSGRLYVRHGIGVTIFAKSSSGTVPDSVAAIWRAMDLAGLTSTLRDRVTRDGRYYKQAYVIRPDAPPSVFYAPFRDGAPGGDTLHVPAYPGLAFVRPALLRLGVDRLMLQGLNQVPFGAAPVWDVTPDGTLLSTDGASSILIETDATGDTLRTIRLPEWPVRPVPAQKRADSLRALEERIARVPRPLNEVEGLGEGVAERRLPDVLPRGIGLRAGQDGTIWIEQWPPEGNSDYRCYVVLDEAGKLLRVVVFRSPIASDPPPYFGEHAVVGVIRDPDTGVERVVRFDLPRL